jgi:group I intron endonuclease
MGLAGVYAIINNVTGAIYIGSYINIGNRLVEHLVYKDTNEHLQNAIAKYGLVNFTFAVVELCDCEVLLQREQHYLDILFSLPGDSLTFGIIFLLSPSYEGLEHL